MVSLTSPSLLRTRSRSLQPSEREILTDSWSTPRSAALVSSSSFSNNKKYLQPQHYSHGKPQQPTGITLPGLSERLLSRNDGDSNRTDYSYYYSEEDRNPRSESRRENVVTRPSFPARVRPGSTLSKTKENSSGDGMDQYEDYNYMEDNVEIASNEEEYYAESSPGRDYVSKMRSDWRSAANRSSSRSRIQNGRSPSSSYSNHHRFGFRRGSSIHDREDLDRQTYTQQQQQQQPPSQQQTPRGDVSRYIDEESSSPTTTYNKYEIIGMKEELRKSEQTRLHLEEVLDATITEKCQIESRLREDMNDIVAQKEEELNNLITQKEKERSSAITQKEQEMERLRDQYENEINDVRSKLMDAFKVDMMEIKSEWENAFHHLKEEAEANKRELLAELDLANDAKIDLEREMALMKTEYKSLLEGEKERSSEKLEYERERGKEKLEGEIEKSREMMEELKRSKEEDMEKMRNRYEAQLQETKQKMVVETSELKEEINCLLEENEKVKRCYDSLEDEMEQKKCELNEMNLRCQKAISDNVAYEKQVMSLKGEAMSFKNEVISLKDEVEDIQNENDKLKRNLRKSEDELRNINLDLESTANEKSRLQSDKIRYERDLEELSSTKNEIMSNYKELMRKLESIEEERLLETRYTEALTKQRDNMTEIIENCQKEIAELSGVNKVYQDLKVEYESVRVEAERMREELKKMEGLQDTIKTLTSRADSLGRERERYNATVKALKVDLRALHRENVGSESSLQEHMRLLTEKWEKNTSQLEQMEKMKLEVQAGIAMQQENERDREHMVKEHGNRVERLKGELENAQKELVRLERSKLELDDQLSEYELSSAKQKRVQEELQDKIHRLEDKVSYLEDEAKEHEMQRKEFRDLQSDFEKARSKKNELEGEIEKIEDVKKGLKKKLESAYYDLEEAKREITAMQNDHEEELRMLNEFEEEVQTLRKRNISLEQTIESKTEEIKSMKEMLKDQSSIVAEAQNEVAESYKVKLRLLEEKHSEQDRRFEEAIEKRFKEEMEKIQTKNRKLESSLQEHKDALDQKDMAEVKRRGEFAKLRQEMEILRSKERHLETHVSQLEDHISKLVADYEARLEGSGNSSIVSHSSVEAAMKKQIRELEKKLEVTGAAMKQLGKSSLLMEKENEKLKNDKDELKQKLKKLVDCTERGLVQSK